jgi:glycine/D-amino acid oxidase-like deaminating enzyme
LAYYALDNTHYHVAPYGLVLCYAAIAKERYGVAIHTYHAVSDVVLRAETVHRYAAHDRLVVACAAYDDGVAAIA